jgi:perosamine synthetase
MVSGRGKGDERLISIPITRPFFGDAERDALLKPLNSGWLVQGPYVRAFEERFARFVGAPHAVASTSCTTALQLAVAGLKVKPGDEVIVPAFTWVATPNAVEHLGARPVFCDIDLATFNIDVRQVEAVVTPRTVGIMPVHLFGLCADMDGLAEVASRHGLWIVEDAACGFGARIRGRHCGSFGVAGCFSFHPRKAITTGEGGMVTTGDAALAALVSSLRDHGAARSASVRHDTQSPLLADHPHLGYNFRMTDIQGALGCAQMERAEWVLAERARVARAYNERLGTVEDLVRPVVPDGFEHGYQSYVCLFRPEPPNASNVARLHRRRNRVMARLAADGIATRPGTHAPVLLEYYRNRYKIDREDFAAAVIAEQLSISLPIYPQMTDDEVDFVCSAIARGIREESGREDQ